MYKLKQVLILSFLTASLLTACSSSKKEEDPGPEVLKKNIIISGVKTNSTADSIPAYWIDGVEQQLPGIKVSQYLANTDMALSKSGKVHVVANGLVNDTDFSQYWIDGKEQTLPAGVSRLNIAVSDEKRYVIGKANGLNKYWIDNVEQPLPAKVKDLYDIAVVDGKVYLAGTVEGNNGSEGRYWVNGVEMPLPNSYVAYRIKVVNNKVYAFGSGYNSNEDSVAIYWVDGVAHILPNSYSIYNSYADGGICAIAVENNDVYTLIRSASESQKYRFGLWKNGQTLSVPAEAYTLKDLDVLNGKLYVTGNVMTNGKVVAKYWVDGVVHDVPSGAKTNRIILVK